MPSPLSSERRSALVRPTSPLTDTSTSVDTLTDISTAVNMWPMRLVAEITPECCPPILAAPLDRAEAERMAETLSVLSDPARIQLVSILAARPEREACVCDLSGPLELSQPT